MDKKTKEAIEDSVEDLDLDIDDSIEDDVVESEQDTGVDGVPVDDNDAAGNKKNRKFRLSKKTIAWLVVVALLVGVVSAVPFLRYGFFGMFIKKQVVLTIVDADNQKPVSDAKVALGRFDSRSDSKGKVVINGVPVGEYNLKIEKKNYETVESSHTVTLLAKPENTTRPVKATGRTLTVNVKNYVNDKVISNASIDFEGSTAKSDETGVAHVVLPAIDDEQSGTVRADGYVAKDVSVTIEKNGDKILDVKLAPEGKVYFLSKRTGKINVMSSNLDGSDQAVVVEGTGRELDNETSLISSPDWQKVALIARRDGDRPKLYVYDGILKQIDDRSVGFDPIGWVGSKFFYRASDYNLNYWQTNTQQIISYDVNSGNRVVVDKNEATGNDYEHATQRISLAVVQNKKVVYAKCWQYSSYYTGEKNRPVSIISVSADNNRIVVKEFSAEGDTYCDTKLSKPGVALFRFSKGNDGDYYQYDGNSVSKTQSSDGEYYNTVVSYLSSPDNSKVFWTEGRDGKNVVFVASPNLSDTKEVSTGEYVAYGWFGNDYVLYSKSGSELFIAPAGAKLDGKLKITDYHKAMFYPGFGGGYGGSV